MSLLIKNVGGEPVIDGTPKPVESFTRALLAEADPAWLSFEAGLITLRDARGRVLVYRVSGGDQIAATADLISDVRHRPDCQMRKPVPAGFPFPTFSCNCAPACCDSHNEHCEPPSELCCGECTEVAHDTFPIRHADGSRCVLAPGLYGQVDVP